LSVAASDDLDDARNALVLISQRNYGRGRDLLREFDSALGELGD
jgi:hypothetical protein